MPAADVVPRRALLGAGGIPGRSLADLKAEFGLLTMHQHLTRAGAARGRA